MNVKAVIYKKSKIPSVYYLKKDDVKNEIFTVGNGKYVVTEDDSFQITRRWIGPFWKWYVTYYYNEDSPIPLNFFKLVDSDETVEQQDVDDEGNEITKSYPVKLLVEKRLTPQMLNELFNPAFYRMVRGTVKNTRADIQYYLAIGTALAAVFIAWKVNDISTVVNGLYDALTGANQ